MTWFEELTGFREGSTEQIYENLSIKGSAMRSQVNGKEFIWGSLEIPSLGELREKALSCPKGKQGIHVREILADTQELHTDASNAGTLFQVASQFNLLEMVSPNVTPEQGVTRYAQDFTQGPACAIAAGAGTIYRNYFVPINDEVGQTIDRQIDCLADVGTFLGNSDNRLWRMQNGYALPSRDGLLAIAHRLQAASEAERDTLRQLLRIGIQWNTQVTLRNSSHLVSQAYCSALPVAYSAFSSNLWEHFATLVLEASYEATICAALLNREQTGNKTVYLTLIGGGAFGNRIEWIIAAIQRALTIYAEYDLDVAIVSYSRSNPHIQQLITALT
ncbi:MAG: hypothetical protein Q3M24_10905 [Candidatus Electrothrix aestuarii]|uniref:Macro domain-containing protein n=1 Tax=Candidatus Electrothrix aestuarii TaxID=3062594 RepID=A0AAU8M0Y6_9BACT|nr:hypothetical protein [Candidatus Electrothrix aestuarii]